MAVFELKKEDVDALITGLAILGTGGGGDPVRGKQVLEEEFAAGRKLLVADIEDVPDDAFVCSGGIMGSVKALEKVYAEGDTGLLEEGVVLETAFREMENIMGKKLDFVIPFEAGGINTPIIMSLAARLGIPVINGDALGRSAPETQMTSFIGHGVSLYPMPLVDGYGNTVVVKKAVTSTYADEMGRVVVTRGGGFGGNSHYPMTGKQLKESCVPRCITKSIEIGKAIAAARQEGKDPVKAFMDTAGGFELFKGIVREVKGEDKGGFYLNRISVEGGGQYKGSVADIVVKNEYMAVWKDGKIKAVFPDLVCILYSDSGEGVMSIDMKPGLEITMVGVKCHQRLRETMETAVGKEALGGNRYGCPDLEYLPIESLNK
jgi:DUF917 family protein